MDIFGFLHGDNYQGKLTSEITTLGWVWPVVCFVQSNCRILRSLISLEGISGYLFLFHHGKVTTETTSSERVWAVVALVQSDCRIL